MTRRIYLDNAATSWPKPPAVARAMTEYLTEIGATPGRGGYAAAGEAEGIVHRLRLRLGAMTGCAPERVILNSGATEGLNTIIGGLLASRRMEVHFVTTNLEHNAVRRPLANLPLFGRADGSTTMIRCDGRGYVDAAAMLGRAPDEGAVVMTAASNVLGTIQPVAEIGRALLEQYRDTYFIVDAAQTAGLIEYDLERDGIDALVFSGHKGLRGPPGTGAICLSERLAGELAPTRFGGTGADSESEEMPIARPARFEPGTPNTVGLAGLLAAMEDATGPPAAARFAHERELIRALLRGCARLPLRFLGIEDPEAIDPADSAAPRTGVISFTAEGWTPTDLAAALDASFGIAVRAGLHCAPGAHEAMGTLKAGGAVRVSVGPATTEAEIEVLIDALRQLVSAS